MEHGGHRPPLIVTAVPVVTVFVRSKPEFSCWLKQAISSTRTVRQSWFRLVQRGFLRAAIALPFEDAPVDGTVGYYTNLLRTILAAAMSNGNAVATGVIAQSMVVKIIVWTLIALSSFNPARR